MNNRSVSIFNKLRPVSVGFDSIFDNFESMFNDDFFDLAPSFTTNYPPYNIVKSGDNKYDIELALAGLNKKDIDVSVQDGLLTIESRDNNAESNNDTHDELLHQGISKRYFRKTFTIANDVEIKGAELKDGLLRVSMERVIPDEKKRRVIDVL